MNNWIHIERIQDHPPKLARDRVALRQLDVVLDAAGEITGGRFAIAPLSRFERLMALLNFPGVQDVRDIQQHAESQ